MLNRTILMGRLAQTPELRRTSNGDPVAHFSLAVQRDAKDKTTGEHKADFFDIVAWRNTAEYICSYFSKGRMMIVEGKLNTHAWEDKNGVSHKSVEVIAENVYFGDSKRREDLFPSYPYQMPGYGYGGYPPPTGGGYGYYQGGYGGYTPPAQAQQAPPAAPAPAYDNNGLSTDEEEKPPF